MHLLRLSWWWQDHKPLPALKAFWQRGRRGWADRDTWNLDHYISGILAGSLLHLVNTTHGNPCRATKWEDCGSKGCSLNCAELWDKELRENAEKFKLMYEDEWGTVEELQKLEQTSKEALEWLSRWYGALWD